jgi:NTP pyrophosphatase (non-canonical NTP hydrolase)
MSTTREDQKMIQAKYEMRQRIHKDMIDRLKKIRDVLWDVGMYAQGRGAYHQVARELEDIGRAVIEIEDELVFGPQKKS